jgi:hypothetical protein
MKHHLPGLKPPMETRMQLLSEFFTVLGKFPTETTSQHSVGCHAMILSMYLYGIQEDNSTKKNPEKLLSG